MVPTTRTSDRNPRKLTFENLNESGVELLYSIRVLKIGIRKRKKFKLSEDIGARIGRF